MPGIIRFAPPAQISEHDSSSEAEDESPDKRALLVPQDRLVAIEHPCIVKDIDRALQALGSELHLKQIVEDDTFSLAATTTLRPEDPFARELVAKQSSVQHLLLQVAIPQKTGRKRKRGSNDSFAYYDEHGRVVPESNDVQADAETQSPMHDPSLPFAADAALALLSKHPQSYSMTPVGIVERVHRFRSLPDLQHVQQDNDLSIHITRQLKDPSLDKVKAFKPDLSPHATTKIIPGPPGFAAYSQVFSYVYLQNAFPGQPGAEEGSAEARAVPMSAFRKRQDLALAHDAPSIPTEAPAGLLPLESALDTLQQAVKHINAVLDERPVVTRRACFNMCPLMGEDLFKAATEYCGYAFKSGPWRDTLVRFGVDPRKSPEYAKYQTVSFQLSPRDQEMARAQKLATGGNVWLRGYKIARARRDNAAPSGASPRETPEGSTPVGPMAQGSPSLAEAAGGPEPGDNDDTLAEDKIESNAASGTSSSGNVPSHIFDGVGLGTANKTFQIIDITDPVLSSLLESAVLRDEVDSTWGWYPNGTLSMVRIMIREKVTRLLAKTSEQKSKGTAELDLLFERVIRTMPQYVTKDNITDTYDLEAEGLDPSDKKYLSSVMAHIRGLAKSDKGSYGWKEDKEKKRAIGEEEVGPSAKRVRFVNTLAGGDENVDAEDGDAVGDLEAAIAADLDEA